MVTTFYPSGYDGGVAGAKATVTMKAGPGAALSSIYHFPDGTTVTPAADGTVTVDVRYISTLQSAGLVLA